MLFAGIEENGEWNEDLRRGGGDGVDLFLVGGEDDDEGDDILF